MVRLYYEGEGNWGVDTGPGTQSFRVPSVVFASGGAETKTDLEADNVTEPRAWMEFKDLPGFFFEGHRVVI